MTISNYYYNQFVGKSYSLSEARIYMHYALVQKIVGRGFLSKLEIKELLSLITSTYAEEMRKYVHICLVFS